MRDVLSGPLPSNLVSFLLPALLKTELLRLARTAAPEECCGLVSGRLAGDQAEAEQLHPSVNLSPRPQREFEIDQALMFDVSRRVREEARLVLGHYHSHPSGPAAPSTADRARAWAAGHVWLIVAPGHVPDLTAHLTVAKGTEIAFKPLAISG